MNLEKLFPIQKQLDERIEDEHGLEGQDLLPEKILALQVELGELANEWRGFKFWSNDREPRTSKPITSFYAAREGKTRNPLLEEYVDCLHFFLSVAIERAWEYSMSLHYEAILDIENEGFDGGITGAFVEMNYWLMKSHMENNRDEKIESMFGYSAQVFAFKNAWFIFVAIGVIGFEFTEEQIEQAYLDKNKINHARQEGGY